MIMKVTCQSNALSRSSKVLPFILTQNEYPPYTPYSCNVTYSQQNVLKGPSI